MGFNFWVVPYMVPIPFLSIILSKNRCETRNILKKCYLFRKKDIIIDYFVYLCIA